MSKFHSGTQKKELLKIIDKEKLKIHFVGALGVGMRALMMLSQKLSYIVSGSDREGGVEYEKLVLAGFDIRIPHSEENAKGKELLVYTLATDEDNPELSYARQHGIPTVSRAEYLGALMEKFKVRIGVSGSHGKSTTSAMIDKILCECSLFPTSVIGASLQDTGSPLRIGKSDFLVYEACEYKDSFLYFSPTLSVFTNLELEHVDYFENLEKIKASFLSAINMAKVSLINADDENLVSLLPYTSGEIVTFGESAAADFRGEIFERENGKYTLKIRHGEAFLLKTELQTIGRHNAKNALAAAALALHLGLPSEKIANALSDFSGIERRLEAVGKRGSAAVYYDYAHHPTEIRAAIESVRGVAGGEIAVVFKPHTYSRTAAFLDEFASALSLADRVYISEIEPIREKNTSGVSSLMLCKTIGRKAVLLENEKNIGKMVDREKFSAIIIMGAANLGCVKNSILENKF